MAKRGRPVSVWTPQTLKKVNKEMRIYTEETDIPILAEFAYTHGYQRSELYKHPELSNAIKNMLSKKEAQLEKLGLMNQVNNTMAVFSLKQLGWSDKQHLEYSEVESEGHQLSEAIKSKIDSLSKEDLDEITKEVDPNSKRDD